MLKQLLFTTIFLLTWGGLSAQQAAAYWTDNGQIALTTSTDQYIVHTTDLSALRTLARKGSAPGFSTVASFPHKGYLVTTSSAPLSPSGIPSALGISDPNAEVVQGLSYVDGFTIFPTRKIVFRPENKEEIPAILQLLSRYDIRDVEEKYGIYRVSLQKANDALRIANAVYESGLVRFAHPDFYAPIERANDPLYPQQFQMNNTGQTIDGVPGVADMDCNAPEAWGISLGSASVTVAVIDDGLEDHEDLETSGGASRYTNGFTPANNGNGDAISGSDHGVACAGSIAASHNGIGVQGVAPLVNLISVNIFFGGESTQDIADGITWAKNAGADVMSNSWGYTSCTANFSNINNAIADAVNNGRGGLGSVIVFASGNGYKNCVDYPANNSNVIAVGAFSNQGIRSAYSNYGSDLDIMAPSNNVGGPGAGVRTTDRMGSAGYASGNYTNNFGGTSSACPVVSGVAALVLGYNPSLTDAQLKTILYSTAIDMGPAGVDSEYANGRVNAFGALQAAGGNPPTCTDGVQNGQETGVDCGGPTCPACPSNCSDTEVTLTINFDNYPEETTWSIVTDGGTTVASGGPYGNQPDGSTLIEDICLADDCYTFTIFDAYGDGICCTYGSGSYTLTQGGTTLASGASFGGSEATDFCIGSQGGDSQAPTIPGNLTASNTTTTTTDLSWNASSDNVGVTGYNVYINGSLLGSTVNTGTGITGLSPNTTYSAAVEAFDDAGNISGQATTNFTTQSEGGGGNAGLIFGSYFESGLDGWIDGGGDCARVNSSTLSWEGNYSVRIRDNSGTASSMTSPAVNLSGLASVDLKFYFYPSSMEPGEDFWVRYNDGSGWQTVATYASGSSFDNGSFYSATVTLDAASFNLTNGAQFRLQCDASGNADRIYVDEVTLTGFNTAGANGTNGAIATIEQIPGHSQYSPIEELAEFLFSPNPATDFVNVRTTDPIRKVRVLSVDGKEISRTAVENLTSSRVDVRRLPAGLYFVEVTTSEEVEVERLVIKR